MTDSADLLVIGGGIAGLGSALAAVGRGLSVIVIDEARPGSASRAAAGMLAPLVEGLPADVRAVAITARDYYPEFLERLRERADIDVVLDRNGILELAGTADDWERLVDRADAESQAIDAEALRRLEPAFAGHAGALLHACDGAVDNVALMRALDLAVAREPHIRRRTGRVIAVDFARARPVVSTAAGERFSVAKVLLATGAWASGLPGLPRPLPVRPVRGQLLRLDRAPIRHVTYGGGGYLVPRGNSLLIGATSEEEGFTSVTTDDGRDSLRAIARRAIPELEDARIVDHWAGLRPVTPDSLPILGEDPDQPNLLYACGFSRNGILLAPWAASRLARLISGERRDDSLGGFSVARFA